MAPDLNRISVPTRGRLSAISWYTVLAVLPIPFYCSAFPLPAVECPQHDRIALSRGIINGFEAFIVGAFGLLASIPFWLANPAFVIGTVLLHKKRPGWALVCGVAATEFAAMAMAPFALDWLPPGEIRFTIGWSIFLGGLALMFVCGVAGLFQWLRDKQPGKARWTGIMAWQSGAVVWCVFSNCFAAPEITRLLTGYYVWVSSMGLLALCSMVALMCRRLTRRHRNVRQERAGKGSGLFFR